MPDRVDPRGAARAEAVLRPSRRDRDRTEISPILVEIAPAAMGFGRGHRYAALLQTKAYRFVGDDSAWQQKGGLEQMTAPKEYVVEVQAGANGLAAPKPKPKRAAKGGARVGALSANGGPRWRG